MTHVFTLAGTLSTTTATSTGTATASKKHAKQVIVGHTAVTTATAAATFFQSLETVLVVLGSHFVIRQDFVRGVDFLEFVFVAALVGVVFNGQFAIGLFDFGGCASLFYLLL
jgi:hypothetical protein